MHEQVPNIHTSKLRYAHILTNVKSHRKGFFNYQLIVIYKLFFMYTPAYKVDNCMVFSDRCSKHDMTPGFEHKIFSCTLYMYNTFYHHLK